MPPSNDRGAGRSFRLVHCVLLLLAISACSVVGTGPPEPAPAPPAVEGAPIESGASSAEADAAVARLLTEAESRLSEGDPDGALARALEIQTRYPSAQGSSRAFLIESRAHRALEAWEAGDAAAERFLEITPTESAGRAEAHVLRAAHRIEGELGGGVEALFEIPEASGAGELAPEGALRGQALELARSVAREMDDPLLRQLLDEAPEHPWILPAFQAELAERRALVGDRDGAIQLVERARALDPSPTEIDRLRRVEEGEVEPRGEVVGTIGAILSLEGSPTLQALSEQIRDGIEIALLEEGVRGGVQLMREEDGGVATASVRALSALEDAGPMGVVGPISPTGFSEVSRASSGRLPVISPTVPVPDGAGEGTYSLTGTDPEAARALGELTARAGYLEVSVLYPSTAQGAAELRWFRERYEAQGGRVVQALEFPAASNDFRPQLLEVERRAPDALVVLAPPDALPILAAQLPFLGEGLAEERGEAIDIPVVGSSLWASDRVLSELPVSRTNGVLTVAPHPGEDYGPRWAEFVAAYEENFRRTLRDPVPALGYDAALLLIEAARIGGGTTPDRVRDGLRQIRDFPGATGTFSVRDGRIERAYVPVRLEDGRRVPLSF